MTILEAVPLVTNSVLILLVFRLARNVKIYRDVLEAANNALDDLTEITKEARDGRENRTASFARTSDARVPPV